MERGARVAIFFLAACASPSPSPAPSSPSSRDPAPAPLAEIDAGAIEIDAGPRAEPPLDVAAILFPEGAASPDRAARCATIADGRERARCWFDARYDADPEALRLAVELYESSGDVAGVLPPQEMDGGFRGKIRLVPEPPIGKHRRHLAWVAAARRDVDAFFGALERIAKKPIAYRRKPLAYRFFRSVGRTTPSAFAEGETVGYNVSGSLHTSAEAVRDTIFHEVFHLVDASLGDWSARALRPVFDSIVARCGARAACLRPFAPGDTMVRGGTYYAFQPDNGDAVHEYAAELALRYFREQREALTSDPAARYRPSAAAPGHFKCGPPENRRAWDAITADLFGDADATPPCGS